MELLVLILNKVELLDQLLINLSNEDIRGATIVNTGGMAAELAKSEDTEILASLRMLLSRGRSENKMVLIVLPTDKIGLAKDIIRGVVGDLSKPHSGILFTIPIRNVEGIR